MTDVLGSPYFVKATKASISDDKGLLEIIKENIDFFLNLPKGHIVTILLDNGYHKEFLEKEIRKINPKLLDFIKIEITEKITPQQRKEAKEENPDKQGFVVQSKRWIVEKLKCSSDLLQTTPVARRTNAWVNQCRVLWKNCEGKLSTSVAKIRLCAIRLILRRL